ncbi:MAG: hypothetical protein KGO53_09375 [Alphaproteobacteria bacterium]|nr:hypothetical protein [Alphaproteobacteria bacterium]
MTVPPALRPRLMLAALAAVLLALKLLAPGEIEQIPADTLLQRLGDQLAARGTGPVQFSQRADLAGSHQLTFRLPDCPSPLRVVAVSTQEDLSSAARIATPAGLAAPEIAVFAQGEEHGMGGRLAMRLSAVKNYLGLKFGLTDIAPSGTLLAVVHDASCVGYRAVDWPALWSAIGLQSS